MAVSTTFQALGDPVRLEILERLSRGTSHTLTSVSQDLGLTRQGVRKHIQVLAQAGLVTIKPKGRNTMVAFTPGSLQEANTFMLDLERKWDTRLTALRDYVEQSATQITHD